MFANKKIKYGLAALLSVLVIGASVTMAYLNKSTQAANNPFKAGEISTNITEDVTVEGTTINKNPAVFNEGPNEALIRMRVTISPKTVDDKVQSGEININYDTAKWQYNSADGFWYYQGAVTAGKATTPLFTKVTGITDAEGKPLKGTETFQITLYQEAVQSEAWVGSAVVKALQNGVYQQSEATKIWEAYNKSIQ